MNSNPSHGNDLIVDFPSINMKSVRFSPTTEGRYISYPTRREKADKWYSRDDKARFDRNMIRDAIMCSRFMESFCANHEQDKVQELMMHWVGLDHLVSCDVQKRYRDVIHARKKHARVVLKAQKTHGHQSRESNQILARVSETSSESDRGRARKVAVVSASLH
jgi:hypothetical protein